MARKGMLKEEFVSKKGEDDVPVEPCKGWTDDCEFCDKRFGSWVESNDEILEKIPGKPGLFMVALRNKSSIEVRNIVLDMTDIQKKAYGCIDIEKELVADKKSKATKSVILCRWVNFKSKGDNKDLVNVCAHWYNNGIKPKDMEHWPGTDMIQQSGILVFSEKIQKWCHPKKEATWRKSKSTPTKKVEVVVECEFEESCEVCDSNFGFSDWQLLVDVVRDDLAPRSAGIYQLGVRYGKKREVVLIAFEPRDISYANIAIAIKSGEQWHQSVLRNEKFKGKNAALEVRWLELRNSENENSCFLWAHWLNADRFPMLNQKMPGEKQLETHKSFVLRVNDKRWCYEIDVFKQSRLSKFKAKKQLMNELEEDIKYMHVSDD